MGLLRLVNAARLAPLEELLTETRGGGTSGSDGGTGGGRVKTPATAASPSARTASAAAGGFSSRNEGNDGLPGPFATQDKLKAGANISERDVDIREVASSTRIEPRVAAVANTFSVGGNSLGSGAAAVAPAMSPAANATAELTAAAPVTPVTAETTKEIVVEGISAAQVVEIKTAIQAQQKFVGELLEHASRWELEGAELRLYFPAEKNAFVGLIEGRETLEKIRNAASKVLGRAVRVCARLESSAARDGKSSSSTLKGTASAQELRARFENDPIVKSMLQRFGGKISEVRGKE
jgi:hypothetical protein